VDLVALLKKNVSEKDINEAFRKASEGKLKGFLQYTEESLVSVDFLANPHSSIVDGQFTRMVDDNLVKVLAWYDNEWGYSCRVKDLIKYIYQ
jgi:glyceraldehyde 3-phosphate dehydrogenase